MSLFDAIFARSAAPQLMRANGTPCSVDYKLLHNAEPLVENLAAVHRQVSDEESIGDRHIKKIRRLEVDILRGDTPRHHWGALNDPHLNGVLTIRDSDGTESDWAIERVMHQSATFIRLSTTWIGTMEMSRTGFRSPE